MIESSRECAFVAVRGFLNRVFTTAEGDSLESVAGLDLSFTQVRTLFVTCHGDSPVAISDLADCLGLSVAATGRNVDQLVRKGLVERTENPDDRRVKLISPSDSGRAMAASHLKSKEDAVRTLLDDLDVAECDALTAALRPLVKEEEAPHVS